MKKIITLVVFAAIIASVFLYYNKVAYPFVKELAVTETRQKASVYINNACDSIKNTVAAYDGFYNYEKNNEGEVVLVSAKTAAINQAYIIAQTTIFNEIYKLNDSIIEIPVGAFTGSSILASFGASVPINLSVVGESQAEWNSYFYNEGINQTLHRVVLTVITTVEILIPMNTETVVLTTDLVIAEDLIIGRVPDSYITGISEDNIFDLLP